MQNRSQEFELGSQEARDETAVGVGLGLTSMRQGPASCLLSGRPSMEMSFCRSDTYVYVFLFKHRTRLKNLLFLIVIPSESNLSLGNETKIITLTRAL